MGIADAQRVVTAPQIAFLDVHYTYDVLREEMDAAYRRVMESGAYIGGAELVAFEEEFAAWCGAGHCVGVGNGLDALVLALRAAGIGAGDEVIVPANTFIATWLAVTQAGATVVPVDADPATLGMDRNLLGAAITPRTRAIMPVHLYGIVEPMADLRALAERQGLLLIEDAAQAHGATDRDGRRAGQLGHGAGFSFYPGKNLGAFGDAGAFVTDDAGLADKVRRLANYGSSRKYHHEMQGVNSRLDPLQAAFLRAKLARIGEWNDRRREIAAVYQSALAGCAGLGLPTQPSGSTPVWHLYVVRHARRDALQQRLAARGVPTALHYPVANHLSEAYREPFDGRSFPVTEEICATCLSLPIGPHMDADQAKAVAGIVAEVAGELERE